MSRLAYIFPGQGSQFVGMGKDFYENYSTARAVFDEADEVLDFPLSKLCFEGPEGKLKQTANAQPAILMMSIAALQVLRQEGGSNLPEPEFVAGHSLGEYSALVAAGSIEFADALFLVRERGRLMSEVGMNCPGAMAAIIGLDESVVAEICRESGIWVANFNCPGQIVVSGERDAVNNACLIAERIGAVFAAPLQVSGAFHSPLMQSAAVELKRVLAGIKIKKTKSVVIGNTKAQRLDSVELIKEELIDQICGCVRWRSTIEYLDSQCIDKYLEIGPGEVLKGLNERIVPEVKTLSIGSVEAVKDFQL